MEDMIICHHGVKGQKWGVRRYQYEDGTLTPEGKIHYGRKVEKHLDKADARRNLAKQEKLVRGERSIKNAVKTFATSALVGSGADALKTSLAKTAIPASQLGLKGVTASLSLKTLAPELFTTLSKISGGAATAAVIGTPIALIGTFAGLTVSAFLNSKLAKRREAKAQEILDKYKDLDMDEFKKQQRRPSNNG